MNKKGMELGVNDFLDIYLLARNLGDHIWQQEMIEKLENLREEEISKQDPTLTIHNLWLEYKHINTKILDLYNQLRNDSSDSEIYRKIKSLKQQRINISRKIYTAERNS